jgi:hypothetical protein
MEWKLKIPFSSEIRQFKEIQFFLEAGIVSLEA